MSEDLTQKLKNLVIMSDLKKAEKAEVEAAQRVKELQVICVSVTFR